MIRNFIREFRNMKITESLGENKFWLSKTKEDEL